MQKIKIPAEAAQKLEAIQEKYDIFFRVQEKRIWDYFELNFNPYATLVLKENCKVPFTLINDLKKEFPLIEQKTK
ncbi:MAG: hypothetical protein ACHQHN_14800 [Sphingobacteriales bacterium]